MVARLTTLILALFLTPALSAADWHRAETEHYVVTAKLDPDDLREVAIRMEDFRKLIELQLPAQTDPVRKAHIFLEEDIGQISSIVTLNVTGWTYDEAELSGSYSRFEPADRLLDRYHSVHHAQTALYIDNAFLRPSAWWVRQGASKFFATAYEDEEGRFIIGAPDMRRPLREPVRPSQLANMLLIERTPRSQSRFEDYSIVAREAATALLINAENSGLMEAYLDAFADGAALGDAGKLLGDLNDLARQINRRASSNTKSVTQIPLPPREHSVAIRPLAEDEIALIEPRLHRIVDKSRSRTARRLERLTDEHPDSALVWYEFAAAEFARVREAEFGGEPVFRGFGFSNGELIVSARRYSDAKAWAAVNRALELQPDLADAIRLKAEIRIARLLRASADDLSAEFAEVRAMLRPLAADPAREPLASAVLFQSYIEEGIDPPAEVLDGLGEAFLANPGIEELRYAYAVALARGGEVAVARELLISMLNHPEFAEAAQRALDAAP